MNFLKRWASSSSCIAGTVTPHYRHLLVCTGTDDWPSDWTKDDDQGGISTYMQELLGAVSFLDGPPKITATNTPSRMKDKETDMGKDIFMYPECIILFGVKRSQFPALSQYLEKTSRIALSVIDPHADLIMSKTAGRLESLGFLEWQTVWRQQHIFVCCHGSRDVRCGNFGNSLVSWFNDNYESHDKDHKGNSMLMNDVAALSWKSRVRRERHRVMEQGAIQCWKVSHVGGHTHAGNVIVYPSGHWFGGVKQVEKFDSILTDFFDNNRIDPIHWRGRLALTKEQQEEFYENLIKSNQGSHDNHDKFIKSTDNVHDENNLPTYEVTFVLGNGEKVSCKAKENERILDVALRYQIDGIEGSCGGNLECGTCHVYIPEKQKYQSAGDVSETEQDILDSLGSQCVDGESRLCCQIKMTLSLSQTHFKVIK